MTERGATEERTLIAVTARALVAAEAVLRTARASFGVLSPSVAGNFFMSSTSS